MKTKTKLKLWIILLISLWFLIIPAIPIDMYLYETGAIQQPKDIGQAVFLGNFAEILMVEIGFIGSFLIFKREIIESMGEERS